MTHHDRSLRCLISLASSGLHCTGDLSGHRCVTPTALRPLFPLYYCSCPFARLSSLASHRPVLVRAPLRCHAAHFSATLSPFGSLPRQPSSWLLKKDDSGWMARKESRQASKHSTGSHRPHRKSQRRMLRVETGQRACRLNTVVIPANDHLSHQLTS